MGINVINLALQEAGDASVASGVQSMSVDGQNLNIQTKSGQSLTMTFPTPKDGEKGDTGESGSDGKSAYEIAKEQGFTGTEEEWLASLKGDPGESGKSAYEIAKEHGYDGTEEQFATLFNMLDNEGDGDKFLSNDGTYKEIQGGVVIDDSMSDTSDNPVQNKVVKAYVDGKSVDISPDEGNIAEKRDNGLYVPEIKGVEISSEAGNTLEEKDDGLYVPTPEDVAVSAEDGNILEQKSDGLYVPTPEETAISKADDNAIEAKDDGLYVPTPKEISISEVEGNTIETKDDGLYVPTPQKTEISQEQGNILEEKSDGFYVPTPEEDDKKVKLDGSSEAKYLEDFLDGTTINKDGDVVKVYKLDGQTATVAEINFLGGATSNIQGQIDTLTRISTTFGIFETKADLDSAEGTPKDNQLALIRTDETKDNAQTSYIYNEGEWVFWVKYTITLRDFTTEPINLETEVTGVLPKDKIDADIARLEDVLDKDTYASDTEGVVKSAEKVEGIDTADIEDAVSKAHNHENKDLLDTITNDGDGSKYLNDKGEYVELEGVEISADEGNIIENKADGLYVPEVSGMPELAENGGLEISEDKLKMVNPLVVEEGDISDIIPKASTEQYGVTKIAENGGLEVTEQGLAVKDYIKILSAKNEEALVLSPDSSKTASVTVPVLDGYKVHPTPISYAYTSTNSGASLMQSMNSIGGYRMRNLSSTEITISNVTLYYLAYRN